MPAWGRAAAGARRRSTPPRPRPPSVFVVVEVAVELVVEEILLVERVGVVEQVVGIGGLSFAEGGLAEALLVGPGIGSFHAGRGTPGSTGRIIRRGPRLRHPRAARRRARAPGARP